MINVKDILDLGYPKFEKWVLEVVDEVLPYGSIMAGEIDKPWGKKNE